MNQYKKCVRRDEPIVAEPIVKPVIVGAYIYNET
jgi:hypothetical protein